MKHIKVLLILSVLVILLSFNSQALFYNGVNFTETILTDDFEYTSDFADNDWTYSVSTGCTTSPTNPYNYDPAEITIGSTYGFGNFNYTVSCGVVTYTEISIAQAFDDGDINTGRGLYSFDYAFGHNFSEASAGIFQVLCDATTIINIFTEGSGSDLVVRNNRIPADQCYINLTENQTYNIKLDINYDELYYNVYVDDTINCSLLNLGTDGGSECHNGLKLAYRDRADSNIAHYLDNVEIYTTTGASSLLSLSFPCVNDSQCVTDYCFRGICSLKSWKQTCSEDYECKSGECTDGYCTKPSLSENLDNSVNEQFGSDATTKNIIALIIIIGSGLAFAIIGMKGGHFLAGIGAGTIVMIIVAIGTALIGWLSPFILFGMFFVLLMIMVFAFMIGGSSS